MPRIFMQYALEKFKTKENQILQLLHWKLHIHSFVLCTHVPFRVLAHSNQMSIDCILFAFLYVRCIGSSNMPLSLYQCFWVIAPVQTSKSNGGKEKPERTHWSPSRKLDAARIGNIVATYSTTSTSLLYA